MNLRNDKLIQRSNTQSTRTVSWAQQKQSNHKSLACCTGLFFIPVSMMLCLILLIFMPSDQTNLLVLGLDSREADSDLARSDTIILTTFNPKIPYLGFLSVPRDLWVSIPGYGSNRINTAHFFAEADLAGSGPSVAMQTVHQNFDVDIDYYLRIRFSGFLDLVDAIGGVDVNLPVAMSGFPAGPNHLNAEQALAFVRDRSGSDDFYRMQRSQIFLIGLWDRMLNPDILRQLPDILPKMVGVIDTDMPLLKW